MAGGVLASALFSLFSLFFFPLFSFFYLFYFSLSIAHQLLPTGSTFYLMET